MTPSSDEVPDVDLPIAVFVLEQTLGHVTHSKNLRSLVPRAGGVRPVFVPVEFEPGSSRLPGWSNWTIRAGVRAGRSLLRLRRGTPRTRADVMFVHTQVPAVLLRAWMRRTPTVVSIDATPMQYDELGEFYAHAQGNAYIEKVKHRMNRKCFERATHLVAWSDWARHGLHSGYGIPLERITVISPGVDIDQWSRPVAPPPDPAYGGPVRILFVGGDLQRKGGDVLIEAVRRLRADPDVPETELHLVTTAEVAAEPGVFVHRGLTSNSPELIAQYHRADIFCLPTLGDCLPMVLAEAAASGLPLVSTDVGAIHEIVRPGVTGELIPTGDVDALTASLRCLVIEPERRYAYGDAALALAKGQHDARANATRIVAALRTACGFST